MMKSPPIISLADAWKDYNTHVLPAEAGDLQRQETRRAFYAGFNAAFSMALQAVVEGNQIIAPNQGWHTELQVFGDMVKGGLA